jgi:hypothetical protein
MSLICLDYKPPEVQCRKGWPYNPSRETSKITASMYTFHYRLLHALCVCRVGQNRIYAPYMAVYLVISPPKIPYIYTVYGRILGDFPAKNTVHTPYIHMVPASLGVCRSNH